MKHIDTINLCNTRILFLLARDGFRADQVNIKQIQVLRDHLRFAAVSY